MTLTPVEAIRALGYTQREAEFLTMAALHSGVFVQRQYREFIRAAAGGADSAFVKKGSRLRHLEANPSINRTIIYRIRKPIFVALQESDNRNRRPADDYLLKRRLMALDYVMRNSGHNFLPTESDKVSYFATTLEIPVSLFPDRVYSGHGGLSDHTTRYFTHKPPIFTLPEGAGVVYLDTDRSRTSFNTFLDQYRPLLSRLKQAHLLFISDSPTARNAARLAFLNPRVVHNKGIDFLTLEVAFRERHTLERSLESAGVESLSVPQLKRLAELRSLPRSDLYTRWMDGDLDAIRRDAEAKNGLHRTDHVVFESHPSTEDYSFLAKP